MDFMSVETVEVPCCVAESDRQHFEKCQDVLDFRGDTELNCQVRIFKAKVTLTNVCPGRRINLAVIVGLDNSDFDFVGMKGATIRVPGSVGEPCIPMLNVDEFCFVIPEDICRKESVTVKILAHYSDFVTEKLESRTVGFPV